MKLTAIVTALAFGSVSAFAPPVTFAPAAITLAAFSPSHRGIHPSSVRREMFSGSGEEEMTPEKEKQIEVAAKSMGFSVKEYKLVIKMQSQLADAVNTLRVTGGSDSKGVTVELDGNSPANHIVVNISDAGKDLGKANLEKEILAALKEATESAKKGQQAAVQKMNTNIAEELKKLGK